MEISYCRRCGTKLSPLTDISFMCQNSHPIFYNPLPTVGIFILDDDGRILLSVRGIEPRKGMLDSFGGFVDGEESLEDAAARELTEELGLSPDDYGPLVYLKSAIGHYPYKGEVLSVLSSFFFTTLKPGAHPEPDDDVAQIVVADIASVDVRKFHDDDVRVAFKELQRVLGNT